MNKKKESQDKKRILYVVNPRSGLGRKKIIEQEIRERTDSKTIDFDIIHTSRRGHAIDIATRHKDDVDIVVAVGGDGTVNEVGSGLVGGKAALGIIPCGSGNGLARELEIPLRTASAVDVINEAEIRPIDVMYVGNHISLNVAGVGFDAYISHLFSKKRVRGPLQYMNLIAKEFPKYKPLDYILDIDGNMYKRTAFLISFANSSQWGNNIHIAPRAKMDDGLMDVCIVSEFPNMAIPSLVISLLNQSIDTNKYDEMIRTRSVELMNTESVPGHVDGEPIIFEPHTRIHVAHNALKVAVPPANFFENQRFNPAYIRDEFLFKGEQILTMVREQTKETINDIKQNLKDI